MVAFAVALFKLDRKNELSDLTTRRLFFHVQVILYGFDALDASGDFTRFIDGLLRTPTKPLSWTMLL